MNARYSDDHHCYHHVFVIYSSIFAIGNPWSLITLSLVMHCLQWCMNEWLVVDPVLYIKHHLQWRMKDPLVVYPALYVMHCFQWCNKLKFWTAICVAKQQQNIFIFKNFASNLVLAVFIYKKLVCNQLEVYILKTYD